MNYQIVVSCFGFEFSQMPRTIHRTVLVCRRRLASPRRVQHTFKTRFRDEMGDITVRRLGIHIMYILLARLLSGSQWVVNFVSSITVPT